MTRSIDQYEVLFWVSKCHSFAEASELLNRSRTTLLRSINKFEENLGFKVLNRSNEGISLTPAGERIVDVYRGVRMALNKVENPDCPNGRNQSFKVAVAVSGLELANALYPVLDRHYSNAQFRHTLTICDWESAIAQVGAGAYDVAFVIGPDAEKIKETVYLPVTSHPVQTQDKQTCYVIYDRRLSSLFQFGQLVAQIRVSNFAAD